VKKKKDRERKGAFSFMRESLKKNHLKEEEGALSEEKQSYLQGESKSFQAKSKGKENTKGDFQRGMFHHT